MLTNALQNLTAFDWLALGIGVALGVGVVFLLLSRQVWRYRRSFGYDVYTADTRRHTLIRWAFVALLVGILAGALYFMRAPHADRSDVGASSSARTAADDALVGMKLVIPRAGIEASIIPAHIVGHDWDISQLTTQVAHLDGTAYPGQTGNAVLAGHITIPGAGWGPFHEFDQVRPGDDIAIQTADNRTFSYKVAEKLTVAQDDVQVALSHGDMRLTLVTCAGWDSALNRYAQRAIIVAIYTP